MKGRITMAACAWSVLWAVAAVAAPEAPKVPAELTHFLIYT